MKDRVLIYDGGEATEAVRHYKRMGPMGLVAMLAATVDAATIERLPPEPKPPKQLTDDDHARIQAAADRRAKRNAKRAAQAGSE